MTRVLSTLLGAVEPGFSLTLQKIERAAGNPSNDVRLSAELVQRARHKLEELGLDPNDTTAEELYRALELRMEKDDVRVRDALHIKSDASSQDIVQAIIQYVLRDKNTEYLTFALKPSVARRMLKKQPPKRVMKHLRYRSLDSLLKHESPQHIYIAGFLCESPAWRKKLLEQYVKLRPSDFESRPVDISMPQTDRWTTLARDAVNTQRHSIFVAKELGAVVVFPSDTAMPGMAIATLVLLLNALNDVMSAGSYMKLRQVKPDFGSIVRETITHEPMTSARISQEPVPWRVVHQFYARHAHKRGAAPFEPHVSSTDLRWYHPEAVLATLNQDLIFWQDTRYTGFLHNGASVSLNVLDVAINYCNQFPFPQRISQFMRQQLWHECILRYLSQDNVERALNGDLAPQLAYEPVLVDDDSNSDVL